MARARKLPSGSWRTRVYSHNEGDKRIYKSFTADTKAESEMLAAEYLVHRGDIRAKEKDRELLTVRECIERYIALSEVVSPTTIDSYNSILNFAFQDIMSLQIKDIDDIVMQGAINRESKRKTIKGSTIAPKTIANEYNLVATAIKKMTRVTFDVKLPKRARNIKELPPALEVMQKIKGTDIEIPCLLAMWLSFSMSEIRGLKWSALRKGIIYVEQVKVRTSEGDVVKNVAKAENRIRKHKVPKYILDLLKKEQGYKDYKKGIDGYIVTMPPNTIRKHLKALVGENMTFHSLRHLNASVMLMLNIPEKYAMERGGWKSNSTLKNVYQHTFSSERELVDEKIDTYFENLLDKL